MQKNNNVSVAEVRQEIENAIEIGMKSKDPKGQAHWKSISNNGKMPTLEEKIIYLVKETKKIM